MLRESVSLTLVVWKMTGTNMATALRANTACMNLSTRYLQAMEGLAEMFLPTRREGGRVDVADLPFLICHQGEGRCRLEELKDGKRPDVF